jgi:hypothetical protein
MCSILIAQKSDLIVRFSVCVEISLRLWNKVNYLRNSHYIPHPHTGQRTNDTKGN